MPDIFEILSYFSKLSSSFFNFSLIYLFLILLELPQITLFLRQISRLVSKILKKKLNYFNAYLTYTNLIGVLLFITWGSKKFEALPVIQKSLQIFNFFFSNLFLVFFMIYLTHHVIFKKSFSDLLSLFIRPIHDIWGTKSKFLKTRLQWAIAPTISAFLSFFFFSFWICEFMIAYSWASLLFLSILCILFFKRKLFRRLQNLVNKYQRSHHSKNKD